MVGVGRLAGKPEPARRTEEPGFTAAHLVDHQAAVDPVRGEGHIRVGGQRWAVGTQPPISKDTRAAEMSPIEP